MAVLFVRHAVAKDRDTWEREDDERPLTSRGRSQAEALVALLSEFAVDEVLSSPSVRCVDTVAPLAAARGLSVQPVRELAEGNGRRAAELVAKLLERDARAVLSSHGDVIPDAMERLGLDCDRCAKGSTWVLEGGRARYIAAP